MKENKVDIYEAKVIDLPGILDLFRHSILNLCFNDYDAAQLEAWTSSVEDKSRWENKIREQIFLKALINDKIVGFGSLDRYSEIDLMYIHGDYAGRGIAAQLYTTLETIALEAGTKEIIAEVSITARTFFKKRGFEVKKENTLNRKGTILTNFSMIKYLEHR